MRLQNYRQDRAHRSTAGNAENIRICKRITQQRLKTGSCNSQRSAYEDAEQNARQTNIEDDEAVIAGERTGLMESEANQIIGQAVERNLKRAKLQRQRG